MVYFINSETQNFFGNTILGTKHIFTTCTGLYKSTPLMAFILASSIAILFCSMSSDEFVL